MTNPSTDTKKLRLTRTVEFVERDGSVFITVPSTGQILLANAAAAIIVRALEKGAGRAALTTLVRDAHRDEHGARPDTGRVALDVDRCLADLAAEGLLDHAQL